MQLAARLAKKKAEAAEASDPDAADNVALEAASQLSEEPSETMIDLGNPPERDVQNSGLQISGLRKGGAASKFSGLFNASDDSSSDGEQSFDEDDAGRDLTLSRSGGDYEEDANNAGSQRRQYTTEAKERTPLDDEDDEDLGEAIDAKLVLGGGPFADPTEDSSDDDELVEIRPRRTS